MPHGPTAPRAFIGAAAFVLAASLLLVAAVPDGRGAATGIGLGILSVDGASAENLTLPLGGTYYLAVATDDATSFVNASVTYNGSLLAEENRTGSGATFVSLPAGNYSVSLAGHGRAALAWDFTNGTATNFPDGETLVAFLLPSAGPRIHVAVAMGDAQALVLRLYDDTLSAAGNATLNTSRTVDFLLPSGRSSYAVLVASVTAGNPAGVYGLSWTAGPLNPPLDLTAWPFFLLWIFVPVAIAAVVFVLLHRRRARRGLGP